jgi:glucokinase
MINPGHIALVADIGGTHARFALANLETLEIQNFRKLKVSG